MTTSIGSMPTNRETPVWQLLFGIIDKPVVTFEAVKARHSRWLWLVPLLVVIAAFVVVTFVQMPYTLEAAREQAELQLADLPAEQAEAARETMAFTLSLPFMLAMGLGAGIIILLLGVLMQAAFLFFGSLMIGGDDVSFGSVFTMATWARLPMAIGYLVQAGFIFFTQGAILYPGLAFLVSTGNVLEDAQNPLMILLSSIDIFWLWNLLLLVLGLSVVAKVGRGKSFVLVLLYALLALGLTVLPALIFGGAM